MALIILCVTLRSTLFLLLSPFYCCRHHRHRSRRLYNRELDAICNISSSSSWVENKKWKWTGHWWNVQDIKSELTSVCVRPKYSYEQYNSNKAQNQYINMQTWSSLPRTRIHPSLLPTVIRKPGHNIISCFEVLHGHISYMEQKDVGETERGEGLKYFNYAVVELVHYWRGMQSSGRRVASPPSTLIQLPALSEYVIILAAFRRCGPNFSFKVDVRICHYSVFRRQDNRPPTLGILNYFQFLFH
jgi:hypothetical protein